MSLYFDSDYYDMIYEINFNRYTNGTRDTVSDDNNQYIETDDDGNLLIRSQEIPFYQKFIHIPLFYHNFASMSNQIMRKMIFSQNTVHSVCRARNIHIMQQAPHSIALCRACYGFRGYYSIIIRFRRVRSTAFRTPL